MNRPTASGAGVLAALACAVAAAGCTFRSAEMTQPRAIVVAAMSDAPPLRTGDRVKVHLRRDALGVAGSAPIGLDPDGRSRTDFWLEGTVNMNRPSWLTLELADGRRLVAATDKILFIELLDPPQGPRRPTTNSTP